MWSMVWRMWTSETFSIRQSCCVRTCSEYDGGRLTRTGSIYFLLTYQRSGSNMLAQLKTEESFGLPDNQVFQWSNLEKKRYMFMMLAHPRWTPGPDFLHHLGTRRLMLDSWSSGFGLTEEHVQLLVWVGDNKNKPDGCLGPWCDTYQPSIRTGSLDLLSTHTELLGRPSQAGLEKNPSKRLPASICRTHPYHTSQLVGSSSGDPWEYCGGRCVQGRSFSSDVCGP